MNIMNIKRGFWRLWLVLTVLFVTYMTSLHGGNIVYLFQLQAEVDELVADGGRGVPVPCDDATVRKMGTAQDTTKRTDLNKVFCFYPLSEVRQSWPEYSGKADIELLKDLYLEAGVSLPEVYPWQNLLYIASVTFGLPLAVLAFGWAVAGFAGAARKPT